MTENGSGRTNGEPSDAQLLERWRAGDEAAGNQLVRRHFDALFRFFRSRVDEGVADLVQQTFLGCVESADRMPDEVEFRPWLFGIARKKLLMQLRAAKRRRKVITGEHEPPDAGRGPSLSAALGDRERRKLLLRALRRLPVDLQLLLELHYWESMGVTELAEVFEIPAGTIKSRLHRAREQLREHVGQLSPSSDTADVTVAELEQWARELGRRET
jgi:RNA polymerase sigma factor (sigma-70 family)